MFISVLLGMILSVTLNFCLAPIYRHNGAAIAIVATEILVTVLYFHFARKYFTYKYDWSFLLKTFYSVLPFALIVAAVRWLDMTPLLTLTVSVVLCAGSYFVLQYSVFRSVFVLQVINFVFAKFGLKQISR